MTDHLHSMQAKRIQELEAELEALKNGPVTPADPSDNCAFMQFGDMLTESGWGIALTASPTRRSYLSCGYGASGVTYRFDYGTKGLYVLISFDNDGKLDDISAHAQPHLYR